MVAYMYSVCSLSCSLPVVLEAEARIIFFASTLERERYSYV